MRTPTDAELLGRFQRRLAGIELDVRNAPSKPPFAGRQSGRRARGRQLAGSRLLLIPAAAALVVLAVGVRPALIPAGAPDSDWRLDACFARQPGVAIIESFDVAHVRDLFPRMSAADRNRIGPGTDERPGFVVRLRGKFKIVQPAVGPFASQTFEVDDPTCLLVFATDGTFPAGETPLFLGPIR
jgi:hypothetical protein